MLALPNIDTRSSRGFAEVPASKLAAAGVFAPLKRGDEGCEGIAIVPMQLSDIEQLALFPRLSFASLSCLQVAGLMGALFV